MKNNKTKTYFKYFGGIEIEHLARENLQQHLRIKGHASGAQLDPIWKLLPEQIVFAALMNLANMHPFV